MDALWTLVWKGLVTNDTLHPLRAYVAARSERAARRAPTLPLAPAGAAVGRGPLVGGADARNGPRPRRGPRPPHRAAARHATAWSTREVTALEPVPGGFSAIYPVLRRLEETGRVRRGYFVAGLGAAQFAQPGAVDLLRAERDPAAAPAAVTAGGHRSRQPLRRAGRLADWPGAETSEPAGSAGARVVLVDGQPSAWIARGDRQLLVALPDEEPDRSTRGRALARELVRLAETSPPSAAAG